MIRRPVLAVSSLLLVTLLFAVTAAPALASTVTVTSLNDDFSPGTLRYALFHVADGDTINIVVSGELRLDATQGPLLVRNSVTINGPGPLNRFGPGGLDISGNRATQVFDVYDGLVVNISGMTILLGTSGVGGGLFLGHSTLMLTHMDFRLNTATGNGGGIYNGGGTLTVSNSNFFFNVATENGGGAIFNDHGTVTVTDSTVDTNFAQHLPFRIQYFGFDPISNDGGGGIYNYGGTVNISNSTLVNNHTYSLGGGLYNNGTMTVVNSTLSTNTANAAGGAIFNDRTLVVDSSTLRGNQSSNVGGGIYNAGTTTVVNSTLAANTVIGRFSQGIAGGAVYNGGAFNPAAAMTIISSTIAGNIAPGCFANNCGFFGVPGGGGLYTSSSITLKSTIFANNVGSNCSSQPPVGAKVISAGYNLADDLTCGFLTRATDQNNTAAGLDPDGLKDNGGPTQTIAVLSGSPALDVIPPGACTDLSGNPLVHDQRGDSRPQGDGCEIGAFEVVVLSVACGTADGLWHGTDPSVACTSTPVANLVNPSDASFFLTTNVPAGVETASAETNSHQVCVAGGTCDTAGPIGGNKVDKKAPTWGCGNPDGLWHANDVQISCAASDGGSGLANPADALFTVTTNVASGNETANAIAGPRTICDAVNNCAAAQVGGNRIDKNPPAIGIASPAPGGVYVLNQSVASNYSCVDGGSGTAYCAGPVSSGGMFDTSSVGGKTFTVSAADNVGNTTSFGQSYVVSYNVCSPDNGSRAVKSGATLPVKLTLCTLGGQDLSAAGIVVTAVQIQQYGATFAVGAAGNANPGNVFRFDASMGTTGGYIFNMKTSGLVAGSYQLLFAVSGDPAMHSLPFQIK